MTTLGSDSVAQPRFRSTHEISVRMALGAQRASVVGQIVRQELRVNVTHGERKPYDRANVRHIEQHDVPKTNRRLEVSN